MWDAIAASGLPVHFHTIGGPGRDFSKLTGKTLLAARAASITSFQMHMADVLMSMIFAGVLHHRPQMKMVIGEARHWSGSPIYSTAWTPSAEDQFKELDLVMKPSEYWKRQCYATYQSSSRSG